MLTFEVLCEVDLRHVVVDLASLRRRNVRAGVFAFVDKLLEEGVDLADEGLTVQSALHLLFSVFILLRVISDWRVLKEAARYMGLTK